MVLFLGIAEGLGDTPRAMSQENVELIKAIQPTDVDLVELIPEGEVASQAAMSPLFDVFAEDFSVHFISPKMELPEYHGVAGLVSAWREWLTPWASYQIEAEKFIAAGNEVVVLARIRGRTVQSGVAVEHSPAAIWSIRKGRVAGLRFYLERQEALEAVGLSEQNVHADS